MISKETARKVFNTYAEIEKSQEIIKTLKVAIKKAENEKDEYVIENRYYCDMDLRVPFGADSSSYHVKRVDNKMSLKVLKAHIKTQQKILLKLKDICIKELKDHLTSDK